MDTPQTLDPSYFLRSAYIEELFREKMDWILSMFKIRETTHPEIKIFHDVIVRKDPPILEPALIKPGEEMIPYYEGIETRTETIKVGKYGFAVEFQFDDMSDAAMVDGIKRKLDAAIWQLARTLGCLYLDAVLKDSTAQIKTSKGWGLKVCDPVKDLLGLKIKMDLDWPAFIDPNQVWLAPKNHRELYERLAKLTFRDVEDKPILDILQSLIGIALGESKVAGLEIKKSPPGFVPDGTALMMGGEIPVTLWYMHDEEHSEDGLIHTMQEEIRNAETDELEKLIVKIWVDVVVHIREPHTIGVLTGL